MNKLKKILLLLIVGIISVSAFADAERYWNGKQYLPIGSPDRKFELAVTMARIQGYSTIDKFGFVPLVETGDTSDVWEFGGEYTYDAFGTAPIAYVSSSSALDLQKTSVQGLDITGTLSEQEITLTGQTPVVLNPPLWRIFRMENNGNEGEELNGIIYCHTDPAPTNGVPSDVAVRAIMSPGNNQTLMALYTIPKGKIGFLYRGELGIQAEGNTGTLAEYARVRYKSRRAGMLFKVKKDLSLMVGGGSAVYQDPRSFPDIIPDLTDIKIQVNEVSQDMGLWAAFDILLVDERFFPDSFLQAIGQSNYPTP